MIEEKLISLLFIGSDKSGFDFFSSQIAKDENPFIHFSNEQAVTLEIGMSMMQRRLDEQGANYDLVVCDLDYLQSIALDPFFQISEAYSTIPVVVLMSLLDPCRSADLVHAGVQEIIQKDFLMLPEAVCHSLCFAIERKEQIEANKQLQIQLIQAEKLDSIGRNAAQVAHELKTPLGNINMGLSFLETYESELNSPDFNTVLAEIKSATKRAIKISTGLENYSRNNPYDPAPGDLAKVVDEAIHLVEFDIRKSTTEIDRKFDTVGDLLMIDDTKIEQIVINLIRNSIQAMEESEVPNKKIEVATYKGKCVEFPEVYGIDKWIGDRDKLFTVLDISDNGPGVDPNKIQQIFEPFYTTKPKDKGTGLGLSVVSSIVDLHHGLIRVQNRPGQRGLQTRIFFKATPVQ